MQQIPTAPQLSRTALFPEHLRAGARMVPFAGWEMPVQYEGVLSEVRAVREGCGVFDVSHMGQLDIAGHGVSGLLNGVVSADWEAVSPGRVAYALLLNQDGGVIDDVMGYCLGADAWMVVVNASRAQVDETHLWRHLPAVKLGNRFQDQAMLAVQGPRAFGLLSELADAESRQVIELMSWRDCREVKLCGVDGLLARGGYTGSDGFEFMCRAGGGVEVWQALTSTGATPCGLGARDVLRLEAGLPLYGHELRENWTPYESGCGWAVAVDKPDFVGREALLYERRPTRTIKALRMLDKAVPRDGYEVHHGSRAAGAVTSGTHSPTVHAGIALAMLPASLAVGVIVDVVIRGDLHPAQVVKRPFVPHTRKDETASHDSGRHR